MSIRDQIFEVIVRQALAGAPWREICAGPMKTNNITPEEVEAEVRRRGGGGGGHTQLGGVPRRPKPSTSPPREKHNDFPRDDDLL